MITIRIISVACLLLIASCDTPIENKPTPRETYPPDNREQVTITQGIWGNVWFWEGDFMPMGWGNISPVVRMIYVHELTSLDQVDQVQYSPFYRKINSKRVDSVQSNITGFFQLTLQPGQYSLFVREDSLYYANGYDGAGHILPVTVKSDSVTQAYINITYRATF